MTEVRRLTHERRRPARAVLLCLAVALLMLVAPTVALADVWTDISDAEWLSVYKVTATDAYQLAQGYPGKLFKPAEPVTRGQFAKMAVLGLDVPTLTPMDATFPDVPWGSTFYPHVEGAVAAKIIGGYANGTFGPDDNLLRQQAYSILGKYLSAFEIEALGHIEGDDNVYANLTQWYAAEGIGYLSAYGDAGVMDPIHRPGAAYLVARQVVLGSQSGGTWYLSPQETLNRAPAVALILRTSCEAAKLGLPVVTSVTPTAGPVGGGTTVSIQGSGFVDVTQVRFGSVAAESFTVNSGNSITAVSPATTSGRVVDVFVTNGYGTSDNTPADNFSYVAAPVITLLEPGTGPISGGNEVAVNGVNFVDVTRVMFGDATVTAYTVDSSTHLTVTAPAHAAGDVTVQVTAAGGTSALSLPTARYTYGPSPIVSAVKPPAGPVEGGNTVAITGAHLSGATRVDFGTQTARILTVEDGTVTAVAPAQFLGGGELPRDQWVPISVITPMGTATLASAYLYLLPPTISSVEPDAGRASGGDTAVVRGYHLFLTGQVTFGGEDATVLSVAADGRSVTLTTPGHAAGWVDVTVDTPGGAGTLDDAFRYVAAPTIAVLNPAAAPAGLPVDVTITGTNFVDVSLVRFGSTSCTAVTVNDTTLRVSVPALPGGVLDVLIRAAGGEVTQLDAFTFTYTLGGEVVDADGGAPLAGATVTVYEDDHLTEVAGTTTDPEGNYSLELPPGTYTVKVSLAGYQPQWFDEKEEGDTPDPLALSTDRLNVDFGLTSME